MKKVFLFGLFILGISAILVAQDSEADKAAEIAKKLQDPLSNMTAIMTDNDFKFIDGQDNMSFGSSIQPIKAWSFDKAGFNFIARGVIPVLYSNPDIGNSKWGMGDIQTQFFFSPKTDGAWKWGVGPMFSLNTHTSEEFTGAEWGSGPALVLVGGLGNLSIAFIGAHLWGFNGNVSTTVFQPMIFYNFPNAPGWAVSYNNQITYNWKGTSGNEINLPLGLGVSKAMSNGLELGIGPYWNVVKPDGGTSFMLRVNVNFVFP